MHVCENYALMRYMHADTCMGMIKIKYASKTIKNS